MEHITQYDTLWSLKKLHVIYNMYIECIQSFLIWLLDQNQFWSNINFELQKVVMYIPKAFYLNLGLPKDCHKEKIYCTLYLLKVTIFGLKCSLLMCPYPSWTFLSPPKCSVQCSTRISWTSLYSSIMHHESL